MGEAKHQNFLKLLKVRPFFSILINDVSSQIANSLLLLTIQWWIFLATRSPLNLGVLLIVDYLPQLLLSPYAGYFSDRYDRRKILYVINILQGITVIPLILLVHLHALYLVPIYAVFFTSSLLSTFSGSARIAAVPDTVPKELLIGASSLMRTSIGISGVIGFFIGGAIVYFNGLLIALISFVILKFLATSIVVIFPFSSRGNLTSHEKISSSLTDALVFIGKTPVILLLTILAAVWSFIYAPLQALFPLFVSRLPDYSSALYGFLRGALSLGVVIGSLVAGAWNPKGKVGSRLLTLSALSGILIMALFISPYLVSSFSVIILIGFFDTMVDSLSFSLLFSEIPTQIRGRVLSILMMIVMIVNIVGISAGSLLVQRSGITNFFLYGGGIIFLTSIVLLGSKLRNAKIG